MIAGWLGYVYMYIKVYIYVDVHARVYIYNVVYVCELLLITRNVCIYVCVYMYMCVYIYIYYARLPTCLKIPLLVYIHLCMPICIGTLTYIDGEFGFNFKHWSISWYISLPISWPILAHKKTVTFHSNGLVVGRPPLPYAIIFSTMHPPGGISNLACICKRQSVLFCLV